jgi:hypothetical protein
VEIDVLDTLDDVRDQEAVGERVYVLDGGSLCVFDALDPTSPVELDCINIPAGNDVEVVGHFAYVAAGECSDPWTCSGGLHIIDASDSASLAEIGALGIPDYDSYDVEVVGHFAYVAGRCKYPWDCSGALRIIDVSDPALPVGLGAFGMWHSAYAVEVVDNLAYVAARLTTAHGRPWAPGLRVVDVSDPGSPVEIGAFTWPRGADQRLLWDVEVVCDLAYVASSWPSNGLRVIDVSDPASPVQIGGFNTADGTFDVEMVGALAYVAAVEPRDPYLPPSPPWPWTGSLRIIDFGPEYACEIPINLDIKPGGDPNSINPANGGVVPAAILGSDTFDVTDVDATTLAFGPDRAAPAHCHGPHIDDVNGDGFVDLLAHFRTDETGIVYGTLMACLSGETLDGMSFNGCDAVRTVPDMDGDELLDVEEATLGTNALSRDSDWDGFTDGDEVLVFRTDPLDPLDPTPVPEPSRWLLLAAGAGTLVLLRTMSRQR